ncbi:tetratricopeptide repeat protein [Nonomuraea sp. KC401]|uniref:tetratricopeptide repeat protein n=1 Tax=unclassified Nonomuraea TaxID=2593643 RepID=UPI0010FDA025|nr:MULTISPECIES: tetratricopeptide repeat protein [unclassified Nonomuraea]NBE96598.1 tetratricopeptide repeat protein [Nonomuraea sp. K271]TLF68371.1 tetratricopeptide repeat protein [Nonomuraea sp. KC401]
MRDEELARAVHLREEGQGEEARRLLVDLARRHPDDAEVSYQAAWAHDALGLEAEAVPYYERALAGEGLSEADRLGAFTGYGSTLRVLGRHAEALETFERGLKEFPGDGALRTFSAMALHNAGRCAEAVTTLLKVVAESDQAGGYDRAIAYYADHLDERV